MAIVSPNLGLKIWSLPTDPYDSDQLAENWARVDQHDHSPGKGAQIQTASIADGSITADKIAPSAFPTVVLQDGSVTTVKLADASVTTAKYATGSVDTNALGPGSVTLPAVGSDVLPPGTIWMYGGDVAPAGWLLCDGSAVSRTTYSALYSIIGIKEGSGDGINTFNVPDLRGRMAVGKGVHGDVNVVGRSDAISATARTPNHVHQHESPTIDWNGSVGLKRPGPPGHALGYTYSDGSYIQAYDPPNDSSVPSTIQGYQMSEPANNGSGNPYHFRVVSTLNTAPYSTVNFIIKT